MEHILDFGEVEDNRTGIPTLGIVGASYKVALPGNRPVLQSSKRVPVLTALRELEWFLSGETDLGPLIANNVRIWDQWVKPGTAIHDDEGNLVDGALGPIYQAQWRKWRGKGGYIDQLADVTEALRTNPQSRRHLVTAWNPTYLDDMALPPCHVMFQFVSKSHVPMFEEMEALLEWSCAADTEDILSKDYIAKMVGEPRKLDLVLYMRSNDTPLGHAFNVFQYSMIMILMARATGMVPGDFIYMGADVHIYENQLDIYRNVHRAQYFSTAWADAKRISDPTVRFTTDKVANALLDFVHTDVSIEDYHPLPTVKYPVAAK